MMGWRGRESCAGTFESGGMELWWMEGGGF